MRDFEANGLSGAEETKLQYEYIEKAKKTNANNLLILQIKNRVKRQ